MGLLARIHESRSYTTGPYSLKDPALAKLFSVGAQTASGITVTDQLAMMYSPVFAAVQVLSSDVAKAPLNLHKRRQAGGSDLYTESPTFNLLKHEPNPEMGAMNFRQALTAHALTLGGGYAEIERTQGTGRPVGLWPIEPNRIRADRTKRGALVYDVDGRDTYQPEDILHIHGLGFDGVCGYALLELARQAIGLGLAAEKFAATFFGNNSTFGGVIGFDKPMDPEEIKEYSEAIEAKHKGAERAFRMLILDQGAKFTSFGATNQDSQLVELRDKQEEEASRYFRVPLHKINSLKRATFSNVEQQDLEYYKGPVLDWMTIWEQECNRKLIPKLERRQQFFKHNANIFLRGDIQARYTALGIARDKGIINANEWRELEDMNPQDGPQGNEYLVQTAQAPADRIGPNIDAAMEKTKAETEQIEAQIAQIKNPPSPAGGPTSEAMDAARTRADVAEALVTELRAQLTALTDSRDRDSDAGRHAIAAKAAELATMTAVLEQRQADVAALEAARDAALAEAHAEAEQRAAREGELEAAQALVARYKRDAAEREAAAAEAVDAARQLEAARDAALAEATAAMDLKREADAHLTEALAKLAEADTRGESVSAELTRTVAQLTADLDAARSLQVAAESKAESALSSALLATSAREAAEAKAAEARDASERAIAALSALTGEAESRAAATAEAIRHVETTAETKRLQDVADAVERMRGEQEAERSATATWQHAVIRSLHDERVRLMRGALERECDRARRAQGTPAKLKHWIETWYDGHADLMVSSLLPTVRTHLAFVESDADAGDYTRALVAEHVAQSRRQVATIADLDGDELARELGALLRQWETERVQTIPDALMAKELAYVHAH